MTRTIRVPYTGIGSIPQEISLMPRLQLSLHLGGQSVEVNGLIDSGASVNVIPYSVGIELGADWNSQPVLPPLGGNLSEVEVRALAVMASHPQLTEVGGVELLFAWARTNNSRVILGQINFFFQFDVCFFRTEQVFEVKAR